jgi:carbonic anhydrase
MKSAAAALARLRDGNRRFVAGTSTRVAAADAARRSTLAEGQSPFAVVLGCADSRVPAELVFDQGPGDLFVIRVAGNIVAASQAASIEFAVENFGTQLIVVLGHSRCGAVQATLRALNGAADGHSPTGNAIVDHIQPVAAPLAADGLADWDAVVARTVRANVCASAAQLRTESAVCRDAIASAGLQIVGAEYSLATGEVDFFDGLPEQ